MQVKEGERDLSINPCQLRAYIKLMDARIGKNFLEMIAANLSNFPKPLSRR